MACRSKIPLRLAYALTFHKAQGLTLDRVVVNCRIMHRPGQLGVAVGRTSVKRGLHVC